MALVHLNLEDHVDGTVGFQICYVDGFQVKSNAHRAAYALLRDFEQHAERLEDPDVIVSPLDQIQQGLEQSQIVIARG